MSVPERSGSPNPTRRQFLTLGVGAFVVGTVPLTGLRRRRVRRTVPVMGTIAEFAVVHRNPVYAYAAIDAAMARLTLIETLMTRYTDTSDVGRANRVGGHEAVHVTAETASVLAAALDWAAATEGAFDPCMGSAIELWDVGRRQEPPSADAVRRLAGQRFYRDLDLDRWQGRPAARLTAPEARIDLGGIGKGYGVDQAVRVLRDWGIRDAVVNVGGDLYAMGRSEDGTPWRIGVRSPASAREMLATLEVEDRAIATSGDYLQYFEYHGRRYHHLLDPTTAAPRLSTMHSITVLADDCITADAGATACFGRDVEVGSRLLARRSGHIVHHV
jgi:thiamine biosynthesis lipoprotein